MSYNQPHKPSGVLWRLWEAGSAGHGAQAEWGALSLTPHPPLVPGVPDPGQRTPLCSVPAPRQDPPGDPPAELTGALLLPRWGVSELGGV